MTNQLVQKLTLTPSIVLAVGCLLRVCRCQIWSFVFQEYRWEGLERGCVKALSPVCLTQANSSLPLSCSFHTQYSLWRRSSCTSPRDGSRLKRVFWGESEDVVYLVSNRSPAIVHSVFPLVSSITGRIVSEMWRSIWRNTNVRGFAELWWFGIRLSKTSKRES